MTTSSQPFKDSSDGKSIRIIFTPTTILVIVFTGCFWVTACVGVWAAYDHRTALVRLGLIVIGLCFMFGIAWKGRHQAKTVLSQAGLICIVLAGMLGLDQIAIRYNSSGLIASVLVVLLPLGAASIWWSWMRRQYTLSMLKLGPFAIATLGLLATGERTAWLGLGAGLACSCYTYWRLQNNGNRLYLRWLGDIVVSVGVTIALVFYWYLLFKETNDKLVAIPFIGHDLADRNVLWRESLALIQDYWFTGSGLSVTAMIYSTYVFLAHVPIFYHAHNLFLQVALEQGVPGLIAFVGLHMTILVSLLRTYRDTGAYSRFFCLATLTSVITHLVYGLLDSELYSGPFVSLIFLPLGFALTLHWALVHRLFEFEGEKRLITRSQTNKRYATIVSALLPTVAMTVLFVWPGTLLKLQVNLGTVMQSKAELGVYRWPTWSLQDEVRRKGGNGLDEATEQYKTVLTLEQNNVTAHERLGQIALAQGDYQLAFTHLKAAYSIEPGRNAVRFLLGELYAIHGNIAEAAALWKTVDTDQGQLEVRLWWYQHINAQEEAARLEQAIAQVK